MLELLSPAGSPEAVIAAVQNGADAIYLGLGDFNARRGAKNFSAEEFEKAVRYCRVRGCKVYVTMNTLVNDREMAGALDLARFASDVGASAILVQDLGLLSVLKRAVPDIPLHASTQMSIHSLDGVKAAAAMGLERAVLARELSLDQIRYISRNSPIETEIFVHGALCFSHSGQCYMSSLIGRRSGNRGMCAQPCRMEYSLGSRMEDSHPLSLKDNCLIDRMQEIEEAGVACVKIEGRMKRPEYTAVVTKIYSDVIREKRKPTAEERDALATAFSRDGFTQGYFDGDRSDMFGVRPDQPPAEAEKLFAEARRNYIDSEARRVPIRVYIDIKPKEAVKAAVLDDDGSHIVVAGAVPEGAVRQSLSAELVNRQMRKTGGTPFICTEVESRVKPGLFLPSSALNELRRKLLTELVEKRASAPQRRSLPMPEMSKGIAPISDPVTIYHVLKAEQLSQELAELRPQYLYMPVKEMAENFHAVQPFVENGCRPVAVLPRVVTDDERGDVADMLRELYDMGVREALVGNIGHVTMAAKLGYKLRGDFGMNMFNSYGLELLQKLGFLSATASFELRLAQVRDMQKCIDTELIVYGRLPLMVSDQCVVSHAYGKCCCGNNIMLSDRKGSLFPVLREYDHRNAIYNAHKLFMADKAEDIYSAGLWGQRLLFTTESAREAVEIAKCYKGEGDYRPNVLTRGLYYRGVD